MNVLVVFTHPHKKSLNGAFLEAVEKGLENNRKVNEYKTLDLYAEGFDPVLIFNDDQRRRDMHKEPSMEPYREQFLWADQIIFIYPIWWGRPPAMLMGYIDKLFASEFAYRNIPGKLYPEGLLKGKKVLCISTMKGPTAYPLLTLGNAHKRLMKTALFNFVGIRKVRFFELGGMESKKGKQEKDLQQVQTFVEKKLA